MQGSRSHQRDEARTGEYVGRATCPRPGSWSGPCVDDAGRVGRRSDTLPTCMADTVLRRRPRLSLGVPWLALEAASLVGALGLALWLRVSYLDAYTGSFDEGIRSQQLLLMAAGYRPCQDIFA